MFIRCLSRRRRTGSIPVYLNVYDLTPINGYAYWLGLGIYHSGVQVHGVEYAYGAHDHSSTGIFEAEPMQCPGFRFRKSILIGRTDLGPAEVRRLMERLAEEYAGNKYHLISKNCNHFCNDACIRLTGKPIPRWINRLANLGLMCNCVLPVGLSVAAVRHKGEPPAPMVPVVEKKEQGSNMSRYVISPPSSNCSSVHSSSPSNNNDKSGAVEVVEALPSCSDAPPPERGRTRRRRWRCSSSPSPCSSSLPVASPTVLKV